MNIVNAKKARCRLLHGTSRCTSDAVSGSDLCMTDLTASAATYHRLTDRHAAAMADLFPPDNTDLTVIDTVIGLERIDLLLGHTLASVERILAA